MDIRSQISGLQYRGCWDLGGENPVNANVGGNSVATQQRQRISGVKMCCIEI